MLVQDKMQVNWQDYVRIFFHRKLFFFIPLILVFTASIITTYSLPKVYEAKTIILVEEERLINPLISGLAVSTPVSERLNTLREEILSWPRMMQLVEELGLDKGVNKEKLVYENLINDLKDRISVSMKGNNIITISCEGRDPHTTQKIVNTVSDIFIRRNLSSKNAEADTAIEFIQNQLTVYKKKLEDSEEALRKFKEVYAIQMPLASGINQQIINLEMQLNTLLVDCTEDHPKVIETRRMIEKLKEKRNEEIQKAAAAGGGYMSPEQYQEIAESIPKQEQELTRLTRDKQVNEEIYGMLLKRLETAEISQRLEKSEDGGTKFRVLEPARFPLKPIKPNMAKNSIMGLFLGCFLGIGCIFFVEFSDHSLRGMDDAKLFLDKPVLGSISKIETAEDKEQERIKIKRDMISISAVMAGLIVVFIIISLSFH